MRKKSLAPGSIPDLSMLRCVQGKDTLRLFPIGDKQSAGCGGQPDEDVQTEPQIA